MISGQHAHSPAVSPYSIKGAPRVIAQEIAAALGTIDSVSRIEAAPNGYVNFFLDRQAFAMRWLRQEGAATDAPSHAKAIVEHTAVNPNKAAHIGHLRNAALGDAFGRLLRFLGRESGGALDAGLALFFLFSRTRGNLSRTEGMILLALYGLFLLLQVGNAVRIAGETDRPDELRRAAEIMENRIH